MAVVNEVMTIINVIMSFALMVLIIISTHQNIKTWRLIKRNAELGKKNAELELDFNALDLRIKNLEERLSDSAIQEVQEKQSEIKYELTRIDKTASNNREKIMALQERNKDQQKYNADFAKAIRRVGKK